MHQYFLFSSELLGVRQVDKAYVGEIKGDKNDKIFPLISLLLSGVKYTEGETNETNVNTKEDAGVGDSNLGLFRMGDEAQLFLRQSPEQEHACEHSLHGQSCPQSLHTQSPIRNQRNKLLASGQWLILACFH